MKEAEFENKKLYLEKRVEKTAQTVGSFCFCV